jgi:hypothetical protein
MMVLFLGGPWHEQRHDVAPTRSSVAAVLPLSFTVMPVPDDVVRRPVTYTRRYVRCGGQRLSVYVSPDYRGPARG